METPEGSYLDAQHTGLGVCEITYFEASRQEAHSIGSAILPYLSLVLKESVKLSPLRSNYLLQLGLPLRLGSFLLQMGLAVRLGSFLLQLELGFCRLLFCLLIRFTK